MNEYLLNLFPLIICVATLYGCRINKGGYKDIISKEDSVNLKGFLILVVIMHHLSQSETYDFFAFNYLAKIGYIASGLFFFISGYGLMLSHINKNNYKKGFIRKRLMKMVIPFFLVLYIYYVFCYFGKISFDKIIDFNNGMTFLPFSWFAIEIIMWYLVFYLCMILFDRNYKGILLSLFVFCVFFIVACKKKDYGSWWYNSCFMLPLGGTYYLFREKINYLLTKNYRILLIASVLCIVILYFVPLSSALRMLLGVVYLLLILLIMTKVIFKENMKIIGKYSYYIYLIHGVVLTLLINMHLNEFVYMSLSLFLSVIFGIFFGGIFEKTLNRFFIC